MELNDDESRGNTSDESKTIYDSIFQKMTLDYPNDIIALVNKMFERNYLLNDDVEYISRSSDEYTKRDKNNLRYICDGRPLFPDVVLRINSEYFHIECESKLNTQIFGRMQNYNITISQVLEEPVNSGVLFIGNHRNIDKLENTKEFVYFEINKESLDKLCKDGLYIILPFVIMRYKSALTHEIKRESLITELKNFDENFYKMVEDLYNEGKITKEKAIDIEELYNKIKEHFSEIKANKTGKPKEEVMISPIIQTGREIAYNQGVEKGIEQGIKQGEETGLKALVNTLKEFCPDFQSLYKKIVSNSDYANITEEQVKKYF